MSWFKRTEKRCHHCKELESSPISCGYCDTPGTIKGIPINVSAMLRSIEIPQSDKLVSRQIYDNKLQEFLDEVEKEGKSVDIVGAVLELFGRRLFGPRKGVE